MTEREMMRKKAARRARARKQRNRRVLLTVSLMLAVCVASIGGTIAWLTDSTTEVKNTFSPSNIDITLTETGATENNGDLSKSFKMVPGTVLDKEPMVHVDADSEDCWVFIEVKESDALSDYVSYGVSSGWTKLGTATEEGYEKAYYYRSYEEDARGPYSIIGYQNGQNFVDNKVLVPSTVTKADMDKLYNNSGDPISLELTFKAAAVQKANLAENADAIQTAWAEVRSFFGYSEENDITIPVQPAP